MKTYDFIRFAKELENLQNATTDLWTWIPHKRDEWEKHCRRQPEEMDRVVRAACVEISRLHALLEKHKIDIGFNEKNTPDCVKQYEEEE